MGIMNKEDPYNDLMVQGVTCPKLTTDDVAIFVPEYNSPGKRDATGAFHVGASQFCEFYGLNDEKCVHFIDNTMAPALRARQLLAKMRRCVSRDKNTQEDVYPQVYVFFCHGFINGIQFGIKSNTPGRAWNRQMKEDWNEFVRLIGRHIAPIILLYACSTGDDPDDDPDTAPGSGDDSFGDLLRDALCVRGCWFNRVVTHTTARHSWFNPDIKLMDGLGSPIGGQGGLHIAASGSKTYQVLGRLLKIKPGKPNYGFAWRFPFMTIGDIHMELAKLI